MGVLYHQKHTPNHQKFELIGKKKFAAVALDPKHKAFIIHIVAINIDSGDEMYSSNGA